MIPRLTKSVWSSLTVFANSLISEIRTEHPEADIRYHDWDAAANEFELPDCDLIGPTAMTVSEYEAGLVEVTFAIGYSTFTSDKNLFRLRDYGATIFERMRPQSFIDFYNAETVSLESRLVITPGTLQAPMTKMNARPWQYVQAASLLVPS